MTIRLTEIVMVLAVVMLVFPLENPVHPPFIQMILAVLEQINVTLIASARMVIPAPIIGVKDRLTQTRFAVGTI